MHLYKKVLFFAQNNYQKILHSPLSIGKVLPVAKQNHFTSGQRWVPSDRASTQVLAAWQAG